MARKKRHIKKHYTISVTSDYSGKKTKIYRCRVNLVTFFAVCASLVLAISVVVWLLLYKEYANMKASTDKFNGILKEQAADIVRLGNEKSNLEDEVQILQNTIAMDVRDDEEKAGIEAERYIPSLFPIAGSVTNSSHEKVVKSNSAEEETDNTTDYSGIVAFKAYDVADMVACGAGFVSEIGEDMLYGSYVCVDHGNGYCSIYRCDGDVKVSVGSEVVRGSVIFVGEESGEYFGFQLIKDGEYINPFDVLAING